MEIVNSSYYNFSDSNQTQMIIEDLNTTLKEHMTEVKLTKNPRKKQHALDFLTKLKKIWLEDHIDAANSELLSKQSKET